MCDEGKTLEYFLGASEERKTLEYFLGAPLNDAENVLDDFRELEGAIYRPQRFDDSRDSFVYVPGKRKDRVLLIAHADTVFEWDTPVRSVMLGKVQYYSGTKNLGIGADDRAGCAILYLLKDMGHSLLVLNGEEDGSLGALRIATECPEIFDELNEHSYMIEFDRRNEKDYKTYRIPVSDEFRAFIEAETGYHDAGSSSSTDIAHLCEKICGVNLSVGYYDEHTPMEHLIYSQWLNTLNIARKMLEPPQKRFPLIQN
ncbi:MAG: hypothetical protein IJG65_08225 [Synergistaceae bacterium]|nr:hypothetical protein [Synergistaceae bacterium]